MIAIVSRGRLHRGQGRGMIGASPGTVGERSGLPWWGYWPHLGLTPYGEELRFKVADEVREGSYERRKGSYELYRSLHVLAPFLPMDPEGPLAASSPCRRTPCLSSLYHVRDGESPPL